MGNLPATDFSQSTSFYALLEVIIWALEDELEEAEAGDNSEVEEEAPSAPIRRDSQLPVLQRRKNTDDSDVSFPSEEELAEDAISDEESEPEDGTKAYSTLLQSFSGGSHHKSKKRKLDHSDDSKLAFGSPGPDSDEEGNDVDFVAEAEEDPDLALAEELRDVENDGSDSENEESSDPFDIHFASPDMDTIAKKIKAIESNEWVTKRSATKKSRVAITYPQGHTSQEGPSLSLVTKPGDLNLKHKLQQTASKLMPRFDDEQQELASMLFNYYDVLYCQRSAKNAGNIRKLVCLHALNHILKTRDRVLKNNYKMAKDAGESTFEAKDQGFTRPKVLFILPTRNSCARFVDTIRDLIEPDQEENRKRFNDAYIDKDFKFGMDKPADFRDLFEGNDDDMFRLGVKITRKTVKYYSQFYNSDILFASPLGLRMAIGSEEDKKKPDSDFLSSIEMVVFDQSDALLMQNWEHIEYIFEHLNLQPKESHGCDFSRVRGWYLESWAKYFRQTVIISAFNTPEFAEVMRSHCHNWEGKIRAQPEYEGAIQHLDVRSKQTFSRFESPSVEKDPDARFEYFTSTIVPYLAKRARDATGTLIYIPSYLDFVRVRNYFATSPAVESLTFGTISEYADVPEASRARSYFLNGRQRILLYTERAHHFRRYQIKGVQRIIMYGLPDNPIFYAEIAGGYLSRSEQDMKIGPGQGTVRVMFSKYDVMKLERIVGSKRIGKMLKEKGDTFEFV